MTGTPERDEVIAIKIADLLRVASTSGEIRPSLRLAMARAAEQLEIELLNIQRQEAAA